MKAVVELLLRFFREERNGKAGSSHAMSKDHLSISDVLDVDFLEDLSIEGC